MIGLNEIDFTFLMAFTMLGGGFVLASWLRLEALSALKADEPTEAPSGLPQGTGAA